MDRADYKLIWCENSKNVRVRPKYLYKVMKVSYFLKALKYGDIAFMSSVYSTTGSGNNVDRTEYVSREIESRHIIEETEFTHYVSMHRLIYCFTTNIETYVRQNPLKEDEIVLCFEFDDVIEFFKKLYIPIFYCGRISYNGVDPELSYCEIDELSEYLKTLNRRHVYFRILEHFMKSPEFLLEQEYRFVGLPIEEQALRYYSVAADTTFCMSDVNFFEFDKSKGLLLKYQPDVKGFHTNGAVMDLFTKAHLVNGRYNTKLDDNSILKEYSSRTVERRYPDENKGNKGKGKRHHGRLPQQ